MHYIFLRICTLATLAVFFTAGCSSNKSTSAQKQNWDILVIAPHPDDETLGAAGVIMQALADNKHVGIVVLTNGDGYPLAASTVTGTAIKNLQPQHFKTLAFERQNYVKKSLALIDYPAENLHFLSYPDGGLATIYNENNEQPYTNIHTQQSQTYSAAETDFHTKTFGKPADYVRSALLQDLTKIIKNHQPSSIFVTSAADGHGDHQAAFWFARDAALAAGYRGDLNTYLIHSGTEHGDWPYPYQQDHTQPFQKHTKNGQQIPEGLAWPPTLRVALSPEQAAKKLAMINQFDAEIMTAAEYMRAFIKNEEIFWQVSIQTEE